MREARKTSLRNWVRFCGIPIHHSAVREHFQENERIFYFFFVPVTNNSLFRFSNDFSSSQKDSFLCTICEWISIKRQFRGFLLPPHTGSDNLLTHLLHIYTNYSLLPVAVCQLMELFIRETIICPLIHRVGEREKFFNVIECFAYGSGSLCSHVNLLQLKMYRNGYAIRYFRIAEVPV